MYISTSDSIELVELMEDAVEHYASDKMMSGECIWSVIECIAAAKVLEMQSCP